MSRKLISFDWAIKKLLRSKANFGILEGFLSELLFTDIQILELLESESDREHEKNKQNRVDIKVKDSDGQIILIEVQYSREQDYLLRILFSSAKCVTEHLDSGLNYSDVSKVISVSVLFFDFCKGGDYIYHGTTQFIGMHNHTELKLNEAQKQLFNSKSVADLFPEHYIINVKNFDDIASDSLDQWIYFLKNEEIKDDFNAKGLLEAKEKLDIIKLSTAEKAAYDSHLKVLRREASLYESTYVLGEIQGIEKGIEQEQQKQHHQACVSALKMLKKGIDIDDITEFTGLAADEIQALKDERGS
jgi:predicted transposase/invertase (TIGR01784 family)